MKHSFGPSSISVRSAPIPLCPHVPHPRIQSGLGCGAAGEVRTMSAAGRPELDQLAHALAGLLAAWWRSYAKTEAGEDGCTGSARSTTGGGR